MALPDLALLSYVAINSIRTLVASDVHDPTFNQPPIILPGSFRSEPYAIRRVFTNIHVHEVNANGGIYELVFALLRISDGAFVSGSVIDANQNAAVFGASNERDFSPSYFLIKPGDGLAALIEYFAEPGTAVRSHISAGFFAVVALSLF